MENVNSKANELATQYGYTDPLQMMEEFFADSVHPAICMNVGCDYTTDMEPDQTRGWCEICNQGSVKSIGILLGIY